MSSLRDDFGMYSGIAVSEQEVRVFSFAELNLFDLPKIPFTIVSGAGVPHSSYHQAVMMWANEFGPRSIGIEYGAYIYKAESLTSPAPPFYFMGETYRGVSAFGMDTIINGVFEGLGVGLRRIGSSTISHSGETAIERGYLERVRISIVGFAHTHPVGHWARSNPSDADRAMRRIGNVFGVDFFPIVWFDDKSDEREMNYNWAEEYVGY